MWGSRSICVTSGGTTVRGVGDRFCLVFVYGDLLSDEMVSIRCPS